MGKHPTGSWENRPEWIIEVMTTNPTEKEREKWSMLQLTIEEKTGLNSLGVSTTYQEVVSKRANGSTATRFQLEDAVQMMGRHWERNVAPRLHYLRWGTTYRFRNLVSNEVIPWELFSV